MRKNVINVELQGTQEVIAPYRYQFDYGQILRLSGDIPEKYYLEFCSSSDAQIFCTQECNSVSDTLIPDGLFKSGDSILCFLVEKEQGEFRKTLFKITIPIKKRASYK